MNFILGVVIVFGCVFGGFVLSGGAIMSLWHPNELLVIGGAALGAFVISNPTKLIKKVLAATLLLFKGSKYTKQYYIDALSLLFDLLTKARKDGIIALETHFEDPHKSDIFGKYPKVASDHHAVDFICDYLRIMVGGNMNAIELENLMDVELETHHEEGHAPAAAMTRVSDALPGFGIVAAVLGIVITMGALSDGPEAIGHKVATALVGTFLGILLAYGLIGPVSTFLSHVAQDEGQFFKCLKTTLIASIQGYAPNMAIEFGRKTIFSTERPGFKELEDSIKSKAR